jgi:hypothetical protein
MVMPGWGIRFAGGYCFAIQLCAVVLASALIAAPARAEERLETLRTEFHNQSDPVKRAKMFSKLGGALIAEMRRLESTRQYDAVAPLFLEYHDSAAAAYNGLAATRRDAVKHSNGYRELEMHLRQSLHQLNELVFGLPLADREPLRGPEKDIADLDEKLVNALFPRGPDPRRTPPSGPQTHPGV